MIKKSIHLSDANGDWYLDANNHLALTTDQKQVSKEIAQAKFSTIKGEVFTDNTIGMDWFGIMFNDIRSHQERVDEITRVAMGVYNVVDIDQITYEEDNQSGEGKFETDLIMSDGSTVTVEL